jgi:diguanylate cyclase (GGDEF)-like protein
MRRWAGLTVLLTGAAITMATPDSLIGRTAYTGCFAGLAVLAWRGALRTAVGGRRPWIMVAAAVTSWIVGDLAWDLRQLTGQPEGAGLPDVFWLAGYPMLGGSVVLMARRRAPKQSRAGLIDGLTLTTAAALGTWQLLVRPSLGKGHVTFNVFVDALYPFGDVLVFAAVAYLVLSPGRQGVPTRLLVSGMTAMLGLDLACTLLPNVWSDRDVERLNGLMLLANGLIIAATLHRDRDELVTAVPMTVETLHPARVLFLGIGLLTAPLMAVTQSDLGSGERVPLLFGTVVTIALSLVRFTGAVHEQARVQKLLAYQAAHDTLTGLANRRRMTAWLEGNFTPDASVIYIDLDGFKSVNDEHGHAAGDAVLVEVASRLRHVVRRDDIAARLGGDEFAVVCVGLDALSLAALLDRLTAALFEPIPYNGHVLWVGASIGVASAGDCAGPDELISQADHAMFAVKASRRADSASRGRIPSAPTPASRPMGQHLEPLHSGPDST